MTESFHQTLRKHKADPYAYILLTPTKPDIIYQEERALHDLQKIGHVSTARLMKHAHTFAWLFFNSYEVDTCLQFLRQRLTEPAMHKVDKLGELRRLRIRQATILRGINNPQVTELTHFLQELSLERLRLKDCWAGAEFRFLTFFQEIARRIHVPLDEMMATYRLTEYRQALSGAEKVSTTRMRARVKLYAFRRHKNEKVFLEKREAVHRLAKQVLSAQSFESTSGIHGVTANPGLVRGRVRIVQSVDISQVLHDLQHFRKGDILVTWMTQPNMMPIARLASAIVADEGGITSHAAIIARELGIPCVVGAQVATKVLKDGDRVEVDATKGIVRKL